MADLSTLDPTQPVGAESRSLGDDRIRETREATINSFGGTDAGSGSQVAEHYLKGFHKFPNGSSGSRPTAGNVGRIFLNTGDEWVEYDNGSSFNQLHTVQLRSVLNATTSTLTGVPTIFAGDTITLSHRANSRILYILHAVVINENLVTDRTMTFTLVGSTFTFTPASKAIVVPRNGALPIVVAAVAEPTSASSSSTIQVQLSATGTVTKIGQRLGFSLVI